MRGCCDEARKTQTGYLKYQGKYTQTHTHTHAQGAEAKQKRTSVCARVRVCVCVKECATGARQLKIYCALHIFGPAARLAARHGAREYTHEYVYKKATRSTRRRGGEREEVSSGKRTLLRCILGEPAAGDAETDVACVRMPNAQAQTEKRLMLPVNAQATTITTITVATTTTTNDNRRAPFKQRLRYVSKEGGKGMKKEERKG